MIIMNDTYAAVFDAARKKSPLVHHITNYVTVNDCANITLAAGGAPVMAHAPEEVADMIQYAGALVLNIGTLDALQIESMILAGKAAASLDIPIILDPVGAGATPLRTRAGKPVDGRTSNIGAERGMLGRSGS